MVYSAVFSYRAHLKVAVKFKTTSIWMENRLILLGSQLHSVTLFCISPSIYPQYPFTHQTSCFFFYSDTYISPLFTLHAPQCFVKIANTCFRKGYFNMPGNSASGWDTCWASVGSCSLGSSTSHWSVFYLYINMTVGQPHQEISAFCLFTSSIHPSLFFCIYRPWMIQVYFSLYALSPKKSTFQFCLLPSWHSSKRKIQT